MFTYQIIVEYLGSDFAGWQIQKNGPSIQETLEKILSNFFKEKIKIIGSGRTDAGVHAKGQSAHFKIRQKINNKKIFINSINFFLQKYSISILNIRKRSNLFHARHNASQRVYEYFIINRISPLVIEKDKAWHIKKKLDIEAMKRGLKVLKGTHDFSTFRASSCQAKSAIKTLKKASIKKNKDKITITFQSQSFLQQQVRSMVGSLKYLGEGKWNFKYFKRSFISKKRKMCAPPAPAHGLFLTKVFYKS